MRSATTMSARIRIALLAWLAMLGLDFLLNGALFARMYQNGDTFMLAPTEAFRRIPLGYLAFLIVALAIVETAHRLGITRVAEGLRLGLISGGVVGSVWGLSLYSIATLEASVALTFAVIWLALLLLGWAVAAAGLARTSLRALTLGIATFVVVCVVTVIALQSFGVVPTISP
jgi:hypothetical protein